MARLKLNAWGKEHEITLDTSKYVNNNNLYIGLVCWNEDVGKGEYPEPWSDLTVNLPNMKCKPNCAFIDINDNGKEIISWLIANKLGKLTGVLCPSGFCVYPEFKFDMKEVKKYVEEI